MEKNTRGICWSNGFVEKIAGYDDFLVREASKVSQRTGFLQVGQQIPRVFFSMG